MRELGYARRRHSTLRTVAVVLSLALGFLRSVLPQETGSILARPVPPRASLADALIGRGLRRFVRKRIHEGRKGFDDDGRPRKHKRVSRRRGGRRGGHGRRH
mmetsp:Transcript_91787/g.176653  ORF Transcript_91787/g.176653 Transcript_91787/m.176653 type:complete len:102 (-) Transcript_91787:15-320(-)